MQLNTQLLFKAPIFLQPPKEFDIFAGSHIG